MGSLTKGFTVVAKGRTPATDPSSKKLAIFAVTNVLFKIYFKVNTLQLCGKLINVVEGPGGIMENLQLFPVSDVVMYKYYIGRLKMFEDKYEEARCVECECLLMVFSMIISSSLISTSLPNILYTIFPLHHCHYAMHVL